ncbi:hypothetical protein ZHAS_00022010 [Anopheles sinensis]|uniref:Uncharacterized protein n=1 Tax=Anopheles sinensis TaxID=74873 RepID=A0A084WU82_ANOSI|nr:hypothetical protein ZHAS_00022010 [Anopheles sinensis]
MTTWKIRSNGFTANQTFGHAVEIVDVCQQKVRIVRKGDRGIDLDGQVIDCNSRAVLFNDINDELSDVGRIGRANHG